MTNELRITFTGGALLGEERIVSLTAPVLIGRSHAAEIRLKEADVSGKHVEFRMEADRPCVVCLSRHGFVLNGETVAEGESRPIGKGDVISLGTKVRMRVDGFLRKGAELDAMTFETHAMTMSQEATIATRPVPESMTFATRMGSDTLSSGLDAALKGSMEESPVTDSDSIPAAPRPPIDDSPTADDPLPAIELPPPVTDLPPPAADLPSAVKQPDATADFDVQPDDVPTGASTGSGEGETVGMFTRPASMDEIFRMKRMLENKKRFRRKLFVFSALTFISIFGVIVFVNWPTDEGMLSHPHVAGTEEKDLAFYEVRSPSGQLDMVIDYPNSPRLSKRESKDGIEVVTETGRKRNVPFRLSFFRRTDEKELKLSLSESADLFMEGLKKKGYLFFLSPDGSQLGDEARDGIFFFEMENPYACDIPIQRGTRFFRSEYTHEDNGMKWHGYLILFRDGPTLYTLMREIPEDIWPRGKDLLRIDPNIELGEGFLCHRWESPGQKELLAGVSEGTLLASVRMAISNCRPVDWPRISKETDTLMAMSYLGSEASRKKARQIWEKFMTVKDEFYLMQKNRYEKARIDKDQAQMRDAFEKCRGAFGGDASDRRNRKLNNPEEWSCLLKR